MAKKKAVRRTTKKTTRTAGRKKAARPAARKAAKKTAARRTTTAAAKPGKISAAKKPRTKSEIYGLISEQVGITKKDVAAVFDTVSEIAKADLSKRGPGQLNLGGLMKVTVQRKPATKARKGINPFTGEETMFKAKPARNVVKIRPMKAMKDLV
jgi:nucleoid DNA-binding protein